MIIIILGVLGSIASIVSYYVSAHSKDTPLLVRNLLVFIACLSGATAILAYKTHKYESEEFQFIRQNVNEGMAQSGLRREASDLAKTFPATASVSDAGTNEGIVYSALIFLERNKGLNPEAYAHFKKNVFIAVSEAKANRGSQDYNVILKDAANASIQIIRGMGDNR